MLTPGIFRMNRRNFLRGIIQAGVGAAIAQQPIFDYLTSAPDFVTLKPFEWSWKQEPGCMVFYANYTISNRRQLFKMTDLLVAKTKMLEESIKNANTI
jgi:hypothetical protein